MGLVQAAADDAKRVQAVADAGMKEKDLRLQQLQGECEMLGKQVMWW